MNNWNNLPPLTLASALALFPLSAGKAGGQTLIGGTGSGNDLTLRSTSHATKGKVRFGASDTYWDEATGFWYFGADGTTRQLSLPSTRKRWFLNSDSTAVFNGVVDDVLQLGYNFANPGADTTTDISWGMQFESRYQPNANVESTLSEWHLNFIPEDARNIGHNARPHQINAYWYDDVYPARNKYEHWIAGETTFYDSAKNVTALKIYDFQMDAAQLRGDIEVFTRLIAPNAIKWIKQKNAAGNAYRSLIYLTVADIVAIGDESTPLQTSIAGNLVVGSVTTRTNLVFMGGTATPSGAGDYPALYFNPIITSSGAGSRYGFEVLPTISIPASVSPTAVYGSYYDPPALSIGSGSVVARAANVYIAGAPALSGAGSATANYALYIDNLGGGANSFINGSWVVAAASAYQWLGRSQIKSSADSRLTLLNAAGTDFQRLNLGGDTSAFPSIRRAGAEINIELADSSNTKAAINASTFWAYSNPGVGLAGGSLKFYTSGFAGRTNITGQTDGKLIISNAAISAGATLDFSVDALLAVRNRADSADAQLRATLRWASGNEQTTVGAAGAASALPATPTKYLKVIDSAGTTLVIPAYAAA